MTKKEEMNQEQFALVKPGSFETDTPSIERKQIHIDYSFLVGKYPVMFEEFDQFCEQKGYNKPKDSGFGRERHPVINVSWLDAVKFCNWKSKKDQLKLAYNAKGQLIDEKSEITKDITTVQGWRLLTDAEWEYTASGGHKNVTTTKFAGSDNITEVAIFKAKKTSEAGLLKPNELDIYDMCGNVSEWCYDYYDQLFLEQCVKTNPIDFEASPNRVIRGGSWKSEETEVSVFTRAYFAAGRRQKRSNRIGFRIARTLTKQEISEYEIVEEDPSGNVFDESPVEKKTQKFVKENLEIPVKSENENLTTRCEFCHEREGTKYVFYRGDVVSTKMWKTDLKGNSLYTLTPTDDNYIQHTKTTYNNFRRFEHRICDECLEKNNAFEKKAFKKNIFFNIPWVALSVYFSFSVMSLEMRWPVFVLLAIINFFVLVFMTADSEKNWETARKLSMTIDESMQSNVNCQYFTEKQFKSLKPNNLMSDQGRFF